MILMCSWLIGVVGCVTYHGVDQFYNWVALRLQQLALSAKAHDKRLETRIGAQWNNGMPWHAVAIVDSQLD